MSVYPKHKTGEALGVLFLASSLLLLLCLASYAPLDGSLNVSSPSSSYTNFVGRLGAWLADFLLQVLGLPAFLLPVAFLLLGYRKVRGRSIEYPLVQVLGVGGALLALCAGLSLTSSLLPLELDYAAGGVTGIVVGNLLLSHLNLTGSLIFVVTVLILALLLTTRFSFEALGLWAGERDWNLFSRLAEGYREQRRKRRERRRMEQVRRESVVTQSPPRKIVLEGEPGPGSKRQGAGAVPESSPDWEPVVRDLPEPESVVELDPAALRPKTVARPYQFPPIDFLQTSAADIEVNERELIGRAEKLTAKYAEFDIHGRVLQIHPGPVVTTFEFKPDPGVKYSRMTSLVDDLCLGLKAESIRIDRIPGKNTVGIEVPNAARYIIYLREILGSTAFLQSQSLLTMGLGKLINGNTYVTDLSRMPHLLIAGATGSGKSVAINCIVCSILYKASPEEVRFIMIDPKRLELGLYADIPHLLTPIVTSPRQAANALNWAVREMELRYKLLARQGVRNVDQYNRLVERQPAADEGEEALERLPIIVVIVDELADLMMAAGKDVEGALTRLAQMARATGIHLILATQRPSVDVITGLIKANFPSRISFRVSSKIDSRTILDTNGAEQLLGQGDMLFLSPRTSRPVRIHGGLVTEAEITRITDFLRRQARPEYLEEVLEGEEEKEGGLVEVQDLDDPLYEEAARFVVETGKASTSLLQRRLRIGYGRAARLLDMMEHEGLVGPPDGSRPREVLASSNYFDEVDAP